MAFKRLIVVLATFLAVSVVHSVTAFADVESEERKPNFIVILADDLGYGDLACYGAEDIATPNIDRMAAAGAKFTSFYVSAVCSPESRMPGHLMKPSTTCEAEALMESGSATGSTASRPRSLRRSRSRGDSPPATASR